MECLRSSPLFSFFVAFILGHSIIQCDFSSWFFYTMCFFLVDRFEILFIEAWGLFFIMLKHCSLALWYLSLAFLNIMFISFWGGSLLYMINFIHTIIYWLWRVWSVGGLYTDHWWAEVGAGIVHLSWLI